MRIIAGTARRTELLLPPVAATRPFLELARGALMNALGPRLAGARILDLYAGSGALGLEALSRGAAEGIFVEQDRRAAETLRANAERCRLAGRVTVVSQSAEDALPSLSSTFDLIFVDPPFADAKQWENDPGGLVVRREASRLLSDDGILIFRLEAKGATPPDWPGLILARDKKYGRSRVCRYCRNAE